MVTLSYSEGLRNKDRYRKVHRQDYRRNAYHLNRRERGYAENRTIPLLRLAPGRDDKTQQISAHSASRRQIALLWPVDLRLLQLVGVIHVHGLPFGVEINRADAALAVAVARRFRAAEGQMDFCADRRSVDVGDSGL